MLYNVLEHTVLTRTVAKMVISILITLLKTRLYSTLQYVKLYNLILKSLIEITNFATE